MPLNFTNESLKTAQSDDLVEKIKKADGRICCETQVPPGTGSTI